MREVCFASPDFPIIITINHSFTKSLIHRMPDEETLEEGIISPLQPAVQDPLLRELLADELVRSDVPLQRAPTCRPALAIFPRISEQPDLFAYFQIAYERALGQLRKAEQQDLNVRKQVFAECCLGIWPMLHTPSKERWTEAMGETPAERERHLRSLVAKSPQALLLENVDANAFQPFNMQELTYDLFQ